MNTILAQALRLTVLGMGMTFASIGALALGMLVMTRVMKDNNDAGAPVGTMTDAGNGMTEMADRSEADRSQDAAAAAVAVALASHVPALDASVTNGAEQAAAAAAAVAVSLAGARAATPQVQVSAVDAWDGNVRSVHLSRRAYYDARRVR